jgi:hypothetical protein
VARNTGAVGASTKCSNFAVYVAKETFAHEGRQVTRADGSTERGPGRQRISIRKEGEF